MIVYYSGLLEFLSGLSVIVIVYLLVMIKSIKNKKISFFSFFVYTYVMLSFSMLLIRFYFDIISPILVLGQLFFVLGLIAVKDYTIGYIFSIIGLFMVVSVFNLLDKEVIALIALFIFSTVPILSFLADKNDKRRILKKDGIEIKALCVDYDWRWENEKRVRKVYAPIFEYTIDGKKYKITSNEFRTLKAVVRKGETATIIVSQSNPKKGVVLTTRKCTVELIWLVIGLLITFYFFIRAKNY